METPNGIRDDVWLAMRSARLWRDARDTDIEELARASTIATYQKGTLLFREGQLPDQVAVIVDGHARTVHTADGKSVVLETNWPGSVVGSISALSGDPFESDVEAVVDVTVALVPVAGLKELVARDPAVAMSVISEISHRWINVVTNAKRNAADVTSRVADYLSGLPRTRLGSTSFAVEIPIPRVELAAVLGTTPESLSRAFHGLADEGLIEAHDRLIVIEDGDALLAAHGGVNGVPAPKQVVTNGSKQR